MPIEHAREVMRPLPVEHIAGAPPFVTGVAIVRGSPTPVVNLAALCGAESPCERHRDARFVSLRVDTRVVALEVDAVVGIRSFAGEQLEALPPLWQGAHTPAVAALGVADRELFLVLEAARIVPDGWEPARLEGTS